MGISLPILGAFRAYRMHALLLASTPALLFADGRIVGRAPQLALGLLTFAVLFACIRGLRPAERWQTWICVPVATLLKVFGSLIWGGYHYRLHNIPLYVPPGHAFVYVFGITAGYAVIDGLAALVANAVVAALRLRRPGGSGAPVAPALTTMR